MTMPGISEPEFILTELRYTVGQLQVQTSDIPDAGLLMPQGAQAGIQAVLGEMIDDEYRFRERCETVLGTPASQQTVEPQEQLVETFAVVREEVVNLLTKQPEPWPEPLLEMAREQIARDRDRVTSIANYRRAMFEDPGPDPVHQPLNPQT